MTSRERVKRCLRFETPDRPPRQLWALPIAVQQHPEAYGRIVERFPADIGGPAWDPSASERRRGDQFAIGTYIDEWGCEFENVQAGVIGEVKRPQITDWSRLRNLTPPWETVPTATNLARVNASCAESDLFMLPPVPTLFERMQFLRGTQNLFIDVMEQPHELFALRDMVHEYNLAVAKAWLATEVDGLSMNDDWGTQHALLIPPDIWREVFLPCYEEIVQLTKAAGKAFFLHSDGHIFEIYDDLIEIGVDAVNSQLFCMDIEAIGRRYKGAITFWGEIDRQHVLPANDPEVARDAVRRVVEALYDPSGGVIAQCEFGAGANPVCVEAVFEAWEEVASSG
ncbi:MAG: methyltransferase [Armatimonadetes bacterium]|nr:methyltransferase [Armatimonadota bacterium]